MGLVYLLSFLFASGLGFGLSCFIYGSMLDKSNNIGDSKGDKNAYNVHVNFLVRKDRMSNQEKNTFSSTYAERIDNREAMPQGTELVRRLSEEELQRYKEARPAQEVNPVITNQGPAPVKDMETEFREWERKLDQKIMGTAPAQQSFQQAPQAPVQQVFQPAPQAPVQQVFQPAPQAPAQQAFQPAPNNTPVPPAAQ